MNILENIGNLNKMRKQTSKNIDWTGNEQFILSGNNRRSDAEVNDYYATEPRAVELLLENEKFNHYIWECACGGVTSPPF